ncbi:hypothetical protein DVH24_010824 [Malus domestica]|uniref:Bulb-type lectin domain-containing protein n=1 Tax=Malus domestica TaxID=3750 RepID=A0A498JRD5_MALDO|nr:hypothetical protein DVH24_010824 [Malus domestica]
MNEMMISKLLFSAAKDYETSTFHSIADGETLVSTGGTFELRFFIPSSSENRYVGICYKEILVITFVWVANRDSPLIDSSDLLTVTIPGILVLWSSNTPTSASNPAAQLSDSEILL